MYSFMEEAKQSQPQTYMYGDDDVETDGSNCKKTHYRGNSKKPGYIVYTVSNWLCT